jgi:hypothetical protein
MLCKTVLEILSPTDRNNCMSQRLNSHVRLKCAIQDKKINIFPDNALWLCNFHVHNCAHTSYLFYSSVIMPC